MFRRRRVWCNSAQFYASLFEMYRERSDWDVRSIDDMCVLCVLIKHVLIILSIVDLIIRQGHTFVTSCVAKEQTIHTHNISSYTKKNVWTEHEMFQNIKNNSQYYNYTQTVCVCVHTNFEDNKKRIYCVEKFCTILPLSTSSPTSQTQLVSLNWLITTKHYTIKLFCSIAHAVFPPLMLFNYMEMSLGNKLYTYMSTHS